MKKLISILLILILCLSWSVSTAERKTVEKDQFYLGAMRVIRCKDYVSLRETPDKTGKVLAKVPLNAIVLYCSNNISKYTGGKYKKQKELYIKCEYDGQEGYILKKYLEPAPDFEPAESKADSNIMTRDEIIGGGDIVLDWHEFNVSVLAAYQVSVDNGENWEHLRVGCFIDDEPIWGYTESVKQAGENSSLKAFMGGTEDEPQVYVYDSQYGLMMLDLMDGTEVWNIPKTTCPLGDAAVYTVGPDTGILYITGTDGPDPVAISTEGNILWRSEINDPDVYGPMWITLNPEDIEIIYESGYRVRLAYNGERLSVSGIME